MKFIISYKICGKEHKTKLSAINKLEAIKKINASLQIIKCESEEDETVTKLKKIFGME
jgi:hypothetical protein